MYDYDSTLALHGARRRAEVLRASANGVTGIEVRVDRPLRRRARSRARLEQTLGGFPYRARDWMEVNRNLFSALKLEKVVYFIVLLLIVLVAAFNIVATLIMVVKEKRQGHRDPQVDGRDRAAASRASSC